MSRRVGQRFMLAERRGRRCADLTLSHPLPAAFSQERWASSQRHTSSCCPSIIFVNTHTHTLDLLIKTKSVFWKLYRLSVKGSFNFPRHVKHFKTADTSYDPATQSLRTQHCAAVYGLFKDCGILNILLFIIISFLCARKLWNLHLVELWCRKINLFKYPVDSLKCHQSQH